MKKVLLILLILSLMPIHTSAALRWWPFSTKSISPVIENKIISVDANLAQQKLRFLKKIMKGEGLVDKSHEVSFSTGELLLLLKKEIAKHKSLVDTSTLVLKIADSNFIVSGRLTSPFRISLETIIAIEVEDGNVRPYIVSSRIGIFPISGRLVEWLAGKIFGLKWLEIINPSTFTWESVALADNNLTLAGH